MGSGTTPRLALEYPIPSDPTNVPGDIQALADQLDNEMVIFLPPGTFAARPAAGTAGRVYWATDTNQIFYDTGSTWISLTSLFTNGATSASAPGNTSSDGTSSFPAHADHRHARELWFSGTPSIDSTAGSAGVSGAVARGDHAHTDGDTGWTQPALTNSWQQGGQGTYGARQVGKLVTLRGEVFNGASGTSCMTLPVGMRPTISALFFRTLAGNGTDAYVEISNNGLVLVTGADVQTAGAYLSGCTWFVG